MRSSRTVPESAGFWNCAVRQVMESVIKKRSLLVSASVSYSDINPAIDVSVSDPLPEVHCHLDKTKVRGLDEHVRCDGRAVGGQVGGEGRRDHVRRHYDRRPETRAEEDDHGIESASAGPSLKDRIRRFEAQLIMDALTKCDGNQRAASQHLKIPVRTLAHKMKMHGIHRTFGVRDPE